jgi:YegS/Rv2252/BmrU family lipid kinase
MKKSIRFIINPISGISKKEVLPNLIDKFLDKAQFDYEIVFTQYRGHAKKLAEEAVKEHFNIVCAVGGDGSVNEIAGSLTGSDTMLAILPTGSGNGLARHLGLPLKLKKAIKNINHLRYKKIDTISFNNYTFINVAGLGFDALVAEKFDQYHSRGFFSYAKLVLKEFRSYQGISITINQTKKFDRLLFCSFANATQFGNGFTISPNSKIEDGKFEIVCIELPRLFGFIVLLMRSFFGTIHKSSRFHSFSFASANVSSSSQFAHIDGDPLVLKNKNQQINVYCNPANLKVIKT